MNTYENVTATNLFYSLVKELDSMVENNVLRIESHHFKIERNHYFNGEDLKHRYIWFTNF